MNSNLSFISQLSKIRELQKVLSRHERELSAPALKDASLIPVLRKWFDEIIAEEGLEDRPRTDLRKEFIFIVLALYSPCTVLGYRLPNGIRRELNRAFPGLSPCSISNYMKDLSFMYGRCRRFREDTERIYGRMAARLENEGSAPTGSGK